MRTVYAIQFRLTPHEGQAPEAVIEDVRSRVSSWVAGKYAALWGTQLTVPFDGSVAIPIAGHMLRSDRRTAGDGELLEMVWSHPHDRDPSSVWHTTVVAARHKDDVEFAAIVRIATVRMEMRPVGYALGRPRIVGELLDEYGTRINDWEVPTRSEVLKAADVDRFVGDILLAPGRCLPVLVITPEPWSDRFLVDLERTFDALRGFAHVVGLESKWAAFKLTDVVQKELSCYNGAVRIYWPGFTLNASPAQHRLYFPSTLNYWRDSGLPFEARMFRMLAAISAFRFVEGPAIRAARQALGETERAMVAQLAAQVREGRASQEELEAQCLEALDRIDALERERDRLKADLEAQRAAWSEMQHFVQSEQDQPPQAVAAEAQPQTVGDAVRRARDSASDAVLYLDSAIESADRSPFKNSQRVAELLEAVNVLAAKWKKNGALGDSWEQAFKNMGFPDYKAKVSQTSGTKWKSDYEFVYRGKKRLFEKHVTLGSGQADTCLSVHWYLDEDEQEKDKAKKNRRLVIGYCGRHLTNTTS
jgi:hypothetical protein